MKVLINGIGGKMGKQVFDALSNSKTDIAVCGIDRIVPSFNFGIPVFTNPDDVNVDFDIIIDFSKHEAIFTLLEFAIKKNKPCVLATTGYSTAELSFIENASKSIPVFLSGNMSLGINVLTKLVYEAAKHLSDADVEIIETHHNQKIDSPSGTALMLLNSVKKAKNNVKEVYGRQGIVGVRDKNEVGIHAIRGGTVVGKHEVSFYLNNEVITLKHESESRSMLANGSIKAAIFLVDKEPGLYNMDDMLS